MPLMVQPSAVSRQSPSADQSHLQAIEEKEASAPYVHWQYVDEALPVSFVVLSTLSPSKHIYRTSPARDDQPANTVDKQSA
jgi:hypothetical protein